jgi:hypothetical protein
MSVARSEANGGTAEWPASWAQPMFSGHDLDIVIAWRDGRDFQTLAQLVEVNPRTTVADVLAWALKQRMAVEIARGATWSACGGGRPGVSLRLLPDELTRRPNVPPIALHVSVG